MADWKKQDDEEYINEEIADSQQDPNYAAEEADLPEEQYTSPEKMQKPGHDRQGSKSQSQGWKG